MNRDDADITHGLARRVTISIATAAMAIAATIVLVVMALLRPAPRGLEARSGTESTVVIDRRRGPAQTIVTKTYSRGTLERRTRGYRKNTEILDRMAALASDRVPRIVDRDPGELRVSMTYRGEPLTPDNAPRDLHRQLQEIARELRNADVTWIDPALANFVVDPTTNKVSIIDFGYRTYDRSDLRAFSHGPLDVASVLCRLERAFRKRKRKQKQ